MSGNKSPDEFASFQQQGFNPGQNGAEYEYEEEFEEDELDFEPQNGYSDDMPALATYERPASAKKEKVKSMKER
jgi:hypothetical protein